MFCPVSGISLLATPFLPNLEEILEEALAMVASSGSTMGSEWMESRHDDDNDENDENGTVYAGLPPPQ
jgi:hypothetical protein